MTDPTGTYQFTFDNMGRLTSTTTSYAFLIGRNFTTSYSYDAGSNRSGFTDPESGATSYVYDTLNRLQTLTPPTAFSGSGNFGFTYDALSRRTQMTRPNGLKSVYAYDNLSRLLSVLHQSGSTTLDGASYAVDNAGNRTSRTPQPSGTASNYAYDAIYQLKTVTQSSTTTESYTYDPVGNRLSSLGVSPYTNNSSNELTSTPSRTYTYDNNGNMATKVDSTGTTQYFWDYENRMKSVTLPGSGGTVSFKYNPFGRRIYKWRGTEVASSHNNRTFLVVAGAFLFLLSACSVGETQTMASGIRVKTDHGNPFILKVELRSGAETRVTIYESRLPWGSAYGMILVAVMPDGQIIKKQLPVDDPSPEEVSLNPKESVKGEIDLRKIFRGLDEALRHSDIQLFWAYEAPDELHINRWSGGWILIPKQK